MSHLIRYASPFHLHLIGWLILQTTFGLGLGKHSQECVGGSGEGRLKGADLDWTLEPNWIALLQAKSSLVARTPATSNLIARSEDQHPPRKVTVASDRVQHLISDQHLAQDVAATQNQHLPEKGDEQAMRLRQVEAELREVHQLLQSQHLEVKDAESRDENRWSVLQEDEHASMTLHEAQVKIDKLQQELLLAQASTMDWDNFFNTLKTHWFGTTIVILIACCTLAMCACCGPMRVLRMEEAGCESAFKCCKCCIDMDILFVRTISKLFYDVWNTLHPRTQAAVLGMNLLSALGILMLWWITSSSPTQSLSETLLLMTIRWGYVGCVLCCFPGVLFMAVIVCELWACCSDVQNNFGDYVLEAATDVADFQHQVTKQTVKGCTQTFTPCWQGCKKALGCSSKDAPQDTPQARTRDRSLDPETAQAVENLNVASRALQAINFGKAGKKKRPKIVITKELVTEKDDDSVGVVGQ